MLRIEPVLFFRFKRCSMLLEDADLKDETEEARQLRQLKKMYLNLGLCYIKLCAPHKACICLQKLLALEPNNLKGNFRSVNVVLTSSCLHLYIQIFIYYSGDLKSRPVWISNGR